MKTFKFKWLLLSIILSIASINTLWATDYYLRYMKGMPDGYYDGNTSQKLTQFGSTNRYYCELSLDASSSYGYFIRVDNSDTKCWKANATASTNQEIGLSEYGGQHGNSNHRVTYTTGSAGTYIFTYDISNHKISVSPKSSLTVKVAWQYADNIDGNYNLSTYTTLSQEGSTAKYSADVDITHAAKHYLFVQTDNNRYWKSTNAISAGSYAYVYDYGTSNYGNSSDKLNFTPSATGKYRFTWDHDAKMVTYQRLYNISYQAGDNGTGSTQTDYKVHGTNITLRSSGDFTRTGYNHTAWNTSSTGSGGTSYAFGASYTSNADLTLYPTWTAKTTTVTLSANAPAGSTVTGGGTQVTATYDSALPSFSALTCNNGYALKGYYTNTSGGTKVINADGTFAANSGIWNRTDGATLTLHAQWSLDRTLTYDANGGTGTMTDTNSPYANGATVTVKSNSFTRTGYTFTGWNTAANGSGTPYSAGNTFSISANTTLFAQWSENMTTVNFVASPTGAGTFTVDDTPSQTSTTVGVTTTHDVTAVPYPGYRVMGTNYWTAQNANISLSSRSTNPTTVTGCGTAATASNLTATFTQTYAYLQGRMTIYTAIARGTKKHIASSEGGWDESSNRMKMDYDGTNHRFYLHTYMTPKELSTEQSGNEQYFWFKTSTSSSSDDTNPLVHRPSTGRTLTASGTGNKKATETSSGSNSIWFDDNSTTNGYAIIYFDEAGVWYELEHSLIYNNNGGSGSVTATACYLHGTNATAAGVGSMSKSNYSFGGWNTAQYITGTSYAAAASVTMNANTTLYAKWTRSITLNRNTATSGSTSVTATYNCATLPSITNPSKDGYTFGGWYTADDGSGDLVINTSGALQASKTNWTDASSRFTRTASGATLYAKWTQTITLNYNSANHGSGSNKSATIILNAGAVSSITHCTPATGYHLVGYYTAATDGTKVLNANGTFADSNVTDYITSSKWTKAGATTLYAHYEPNEYTISFDADDSGRPGTATNVQGNVTVNFNDDNFSVTSVKVPELAGYTFGGYYTAKDGGGVQIVDAEGAWQSDKTNYLDASGNWIKAANTTLYAKWTAETYTVTFNATQNGGTCATTSTVVTMGSTYGAGTGLGGSLPTASAPSGYRFAGWYTAATDGTKIENTTVVATANDHTLYAHFTAISYVYFDNSVANWGEVWVTYDATWDDTQGAGNKGKTYHKMTQIGTTKIYRDEIPADVIASWKYNIAFNDMNKTDYYSFDGGKAVFRRDFDSYATMFVPYTTKDYTKGADYYSTDQWVDHKDNDPSKEIIDYRYQHGYWMKYNQYISGDAGYVIKGTWDSESSDFYFKKVTEGNSYTVTKYLPANTTYKFRIYKHCKTSNTYSSWFIANSSTTITSSITNWTLSASIAKSETSRYDNITTTIAGDYEFKITCNTDGTLKLSVTYPSLAVDADWYRLLYSWNDGSAHSRVCETFKRIDNGGSEWVDAFIHKAESPIVSRSLQLQKYVTVSSTPTWQNVGAAIDLSSITKNGVYTFKVTRPTGEEASGSYFGPYEEDYYLRSDVTAGGWDHYTDIAFGGTQNMTYSEFSAQQATDPYNYYYCQYVDNDKQNVAFTIATLNTPSICDTLVGDDIIGAADVAATKYKHLPTDNPANIRFMYNDSTNTIKRAYLKSAQGSGRSRFLVLHGNTKVFNTDESAVRPDSLGLTNDELIFVDKGNWVYEISLKASPIAKAKIIAQYNGSDRYLIGGSGDTPADWKTILGAPADDLSHKYALAGTYDFKNNRLMLAWTPDGTDITAKLSDVDMLWIREGDTAATQINFGTGGELQKVTAVGAIKINWSDVNGKVGTWNAYTRTYAKYFVSFPFDVNVSDIFGLNKAVLGREYIIQKYNGAKRAEKGLFDGDGATFWENLTVDSVMHANEGYIVMFDNDYLNSDSWPIWDNNKGAGKSIYLYFPAAALVSSISNAATTTTVAAHQSERKETWTDGSGTHKMSDTDSHWNLIGGPFFHNATISSSTPGAGLSALHAYYSPNKADNTWVACVLAAPNEKGETINNAFKAMSCIMVQWHGTLTWNTTSTTPALVAARNSEEKKNYLIQLDLQQGEDYSDHAFVDLKNGANSEFVLCEDMMKIVRNGKPNVYVYSGAYDVAYSQVPVVSQTIPVGVIIPQDGTYTFTMPTNFDGTVTLVDTFEQTRTNLGLGDYELYLDRGTINDRFYLEIDIYKVPTAIDGAEDGSGSLKDGKAHKFIENGIMYILKDGEIFDARGTHIK